MKEGCDKSNVDIGDIFQYLNDDLIYLLEGKTHYQRKGRKKKI